LNFSPLHFGKLVSVSSLAQLPTKPQTKEVLEEEKSNIKTKH